MARALSANIGVRYTNAYTSSVWMAFHLSHNPTLDLLHEATCQKQGLARITGIHTCKLNLHCNFEVHTTASGADVDRAVDTKAAVRTLLTSQFCLSLHH